MGPSGRRGVVIPVHGRWPTGLTISWSRQRPILVINQAPEMLPLLPFSMPPIVPPEGAASTTRSIFCVTLAACIRGRSRPLPLLSAQPSTPFRMRRRRSVLPLFWGYPGFRPKEQSRVCRQPLLLGGKSLSGRRSNFRQPRSFARLSGRKYARHGERRATSATSQTNIQAGLRESLAGS